MTPELSEGLMPYAEWLEDFIRSIVEMKPVRIGVCAVGENGEVLTGYYGDLYPKERMASHGMEISGEWFRAPDMGYTVRQQEVADNTMQASQVACIVAAVAMNDEFGFGAERQMRIRTRVEELSKEYSEKGMKPLLKKMAKIGFHIQGDRAIHFADEEGNIVTAKRALEAMK